MKHILIIITVLTILLATGCSKVEKEQEPVDVSRFKRIEYTAAWDIVADRETGVMYAVSRGMYNQGTFTVLVDADGKPLIYDKGEQR